MSKRIPVIQSIYNLFIKRGNQKYLISEPITQIEHALQTYLYMKSRTPYIHLHYSALLHDIGHLLSEPIDPSITKIDEQHELIGSEFLKQNGFPEKIYMPIALHVNAKRYLCTIPAGIQYKNNLSQGSFLSLQLQGGTMDNTEIFKFENSPYFGDALLLREADDNGKDMNLSLKDLPRLLIVLKGLEKVLK